MKTIRYQKLKVNDTRVEMWLIEDYFGSPYAIAIDTARLVDKKERKIKRTKEVYSLTTFTLIASAWQLVAQDDIIQDFLDGFDDEVIGINYKSEL